MEKERKIKILSLVALIVAVLGLTVAFAALSQTLTINGTASVDAANWDVRFESLDGTYNVSPTLSRTPNPSGSLYAENLEISNDGSTANVVGVLLERPGDFVTYDFKISNKGTIDAKISNIEENTPVFGNLAEGDEIKDIVISGTPDPSDVELFNKYFIFKLTYTDTGKEVSLDDVIRAGEEKNVTLTIGIDIEAPKAPGGGTDENGDGTALFVKNLGMKVLYVQQ